MSVVVSKNLNAVAVTDELTVLLDWVNIEKVSGFTIIVENTCGGSSDDLIDVQIDISSDGGLTSTLDHHPGVPAVPVEGDNAVVGAFIETAAYVRIRGLCDTDKDTTAKVILLADLSTAGLCTLTDLKERLGITDTTYDIALNLIIDGVGSLFDSYTGRTLIVTSADVTEFYAGCGPSLQLRRFPIVVITSIKESYDYDFDDDDSLLTVDEDYRIIAGGRFGIIRRVYSDWLDIPDSIEVIGRGGYCAAGVTPGEAEFALPSDLREAAIEQASFIWKRKDDLGLSGVSSEGGSINKFSDMDLLPMVKRILDKYRLPSL